MVRDNYGKGLGWWDVSEIMGVMESILLHGKLPRIVYILGLKDWICVKNSHPSGD